jgi:hypothetical protein
MPLHDPLDRLVEGCVLEHDVRRLAAELERQPLPASGDLALISLPTSVRAGEGDLVEARMCATNGVRSRRRR